MTTVGKVWLGGFSAWPRFVLDFEDPFGTFESFRTLLAIRDPYTTAEVRDGVRSLLASITSNIIEQWENRYEPVNLENLELYNRALTDQMQTLTSPFEAASFAVLTTNPTDRTRTLDIAELKYALKRFRG